MKAWIGEDGFIHVAAENAAERFAMKWIKAGAASPENAFMDHEHEPADAISAAKKTGSRTFKERGYILGATVKKYGVELTGVITDIDIKTKGLAVDVDGIQYAWSVGDCAVVDSLPAAG